MRVILTIILFSFLANTGLDCIAQDKGRFILKSGNFSGIDYIIIKKRSGFKKKYTIVIDCNHYMPNIGTTVYMRKEVFDNSGKYITSYPFIKDSSMLFNGNLSLDNHTLKFLKLSDEEYTVLKKAFGKYSSLSNKYALDADSLKSCLGWLKYYPLE